MLAAIFIEFAIVVSLLVKQLVIDQNIKYALTKSKDDQRTID